MGHGRNQTKEGSQQHHAGIFLCSFTDPSFLSRSLSPNRIKILRDAFTLNVFHNAFKDGLMGYGMIYAQKKK